MTRVSTAEGWNSALLDLMGAQQRQLKAQQQVSTLKVAEDLKGFGRGAETLTAFKAMRARLDGFVQTGQAVTARLQTQDLALNRVADAAQGARQAIAEALASGRGDGLMLDLQGRFQSAVDGLNAKHHGRFLFGGGISDRAPVDAAVLSDLTAVVDPAILFGNDRLKAASRLDEATTLETGFLADELGVPLFQAFREVQAFSAGEPFQGALTQTQRDFLQGVIAQFDASHRSLIDQAARNGALQNRVDTHLDAQLKQRDSLDGLIAERIEVDPAKAISNLQQAQFAVEASAQVLAQLRRVSLLDLLR